MKLVLAILYPQNSRITELSTHLRYGIYSLINLHIFCKETSHKYFNKTICFVVIILDLINDDIVCLSV